jgi:hypothetical protein
MNKFVAFVLIIVAACVLSGLYGIMHDQLTYSISNEYYTKFKFYQFGMVDFASDMELPNPRLNVAVVGLLATWWLGIPIGFFLGLVGFLHADWRAMVKTTMKAFAINVVIAFVTGLAGLLYGFIFLAGKSPDSFSGWFIPDNIVDFGNFISVGSMHNFSYMGGLFGLTIAIIYSVWKALKTRNERKRLRPGNQNIANAL